MRTPRRHALALTLALVAAACTNGSNSTPIVTGTSPDGEIVVGDTAPPNTPSLPPTCRETTPILRVASSDPIIEFLSEDAGLASVHMSQAMFECATNTVIVSDADLDRVAVAAVLAASLGAPLLIGSAHTSGLLGFETERLSPEQIIAVGDDVAFTAPEWTEIVTLSGDTNSIAAQINSLAGLLSSLPLPEDEGVATLVATLNAINSGTTVTPPPSTTTTSTTTSESTTTTVSGTEAVAAEEIPGLTAGPGVTGVAILVDGKDPVAALAAFASAEASGAMATLIDDADLRRVPEAGRALQSLPGGPGSIHVFGDVPVEDRWQLDVIRSAEQLPGGGFLVLPRLFVALYGSPLAAALGALGEQGASEAATRAKQIAGQFTEADAPVVPTFEMIITNAHASPGSDGNWSTEQDAAVFQPWIDLAAQEDIYVILDLQPGASDFLSQAMQYEDLLLNPHVGLALDPEWRFKHPDQLVKGHDRTGAVGAAEVNSVIEWLADLVQENDLPQKVLLLHQFRLNMLPDREKIEPRPELQIIIQMDGFGPFETKRETWSFVTRGWESDPWSWGWKNFYDEDTPGGGQTWTELSQLAPEAVFVSYQ